jgi:hypothetical protein
VIILDDDLEAAPGLPMRWDDVVQGGPMPWDKKDCLRSLALPGGFDTGAYKKWVAKLQVRSPFYYYRQNTRFFLLYTTITLIERIILFTFILGHYSQSE